MSLTNDGNLGIGVLGAGNKLSVAGVIQSTNTTGYLLRDGSTNGYGVYKGSATTVGFISNGSVALSIDSTGVTTVSNLAGTGTRIVVADSSGTLSASSALSGYITGSGTTNTIPKFTSSSSLGDSPISDSGSIIIASNRSFQTTGSGNYLRAGNYLWAGGSGGDYGSVGYNVGYTTTTNTYNYVFTDSASIVKFNQGGFQFLTAPSGTAGGAITFTQAMTLTNGGNLLVGTTTDSGYKLRVNGTGYFDGSVRVVGFDSGYYNENILAIGNGTNNPKIGLASVSGYRWNTRIKDVGGNGEYVIRYEEGSLDALILNRSGNLGLGVTPSAWGVYKAYQVGYGAIASYNDADTAIFSNAYFDGGTWRYIGSSYASQYRQLSSTHSWHIAPYGTAGTAISFTQAMTLDASGNLLLGATANSQGAKLKISGGYVYLNEAGGADVYFRSAYDTNKAAIQVASANDLAFVTSNATRMTLTSAGNVLIGTTTDSGYKLDVNGTGRFSDTVNIITNNSTAYSLNILGRLADNASTINFYNNAASTRYGFIYNDSTGMYFGVNGSTRLTIASIGAATFSSSVTAGGIISTSGAGALLQLLSGGTSTQYQKWQNDGGNYFIGISSSTGLGLLNSQNAYSFCLVTESARDMSFGTNNSTRMTITSSGLVGIGTASPGVSLDVSGSGIRITNATPNVYLNNSTVQWKTYLPSGSNNFAINDAVRDVLTLGYNGSASYFQGCNVGIGTTSPAYRFETLGTSTIVAGFGRSDYGASNVTLVGFNGYRDVYKSAIGVVRTGDYDVGDMIFALNGSANSTVVSASDEKMRIKSNGNVLIGTTTDSGYKLNVNGQVIASAYFESSDKQLKDISFTQDSNTFGAIQFNWKDNRDNKNHWGYVAQDVAKFIPDAVIKGSDGFLSVDYNQAHTFKIAKVEDEVTLLKKRVKELEQQLNLK
jgi:hypothetical protein